MQQYITQHIKLGPQALQMLAAMQIQPIHVALGICTSCIIFCDYTIHWLSSLCAISCVDVMWQSSEAINTQHKLQTFRIFSVCCVNC